MEGDSIFSRGELLVGNSDNMVQQKFLVYKKTITILFGIKRFFH